MLPPPSLAPVAAVFISKKRRQILDALRTAGATSAATAVPLEQAGLSRSLLLEIQKLRGVVVEAGSDRFYLDEVREAQANTQRRWLAAGAMLIVVALFLWQRSFR